MSSQSTAQNYITLTIEFLDGTRNSVEISNLKSGMGLLQLVNEVKGRPVYGLTKNGNIINVREMIKHIPLVNGDVLQEAAIASIPYQNYPSSALNTSVVRAKVQRGNIKRDDVIELLIYSIGERSKEIVIEKDATVDQLKKSFAQHLHRPVHELGLLPRFNPIQMSSMQNYYNQGLTPQNLFGWTDLYGLNRSYDGTTTLRSLGIRTGTILQEYYLPRNYNSSERLKQKVNSGEVARDQVFVLHYVPKRNDNIRVDQVTGTYPIYVLKTTTVDELKNILAKILNTSRREISELLVKPSGRANPFFIGWIPNSRGRIVSYDGNLSLVSIYQNMDNATFQQHDHLRPSEAQRERDEILRKEREQAIQEADRIRRERNLEIARLREIQRKQQEEQERKRKIEQARRAQLNDPQPLIQNIEVQNTDPQPNTDETHGGKRKTRKRKSKKSRKNTR